ncbi:MAG: GSCFA domain-containing protein, partial [Betaproteobacteria bacterium]|nr:GSCFA domain-containing protein [Betaproteobacteria bacterium]
SARYGNIYTARQLLQLFDRAFGYFSPVDNHWTLPGDRFCDPFRPRIEPDGFPSVAALVEDRQRHLAAVRIMFEQLDVFVFTLGLTECWASRLDGAAFPIAPGVAGGRFDPSKYEFTNFGVNEVVSDLESFIRKLRVVNPGARLILTVSPVPLVATYEPNHVLVSTTYSKSVLRVAADMVRRSCEGVCYFPSFEIITGNYNRGRYFGPDLRSVTEEGVDHVMSTFIRHMTDGGELAGARDAEAAMPESDTDQEMAALAEAMCEEELLERK